MKPERIIPWLAVSTPGASRLSVVLRPIFPQGRAALRAAAVARSATLPEGNARTAESDGALASRLHRDAGHRRAARPPAGARRGEWLVPALMAVALAATATAAPPTGAAKAPAAAEPDARLHADGKGWRLDKARIDDPKRPRVLLIGDSILNGYLKQVTTALEGKVYVDAWVNPYCQSEHLNKLLAEVLENGPYDVVHFNMGLHGWQEGRIKPGTFEPLTKAYVEVLRAKLPKARLIWASSTPVTMQGKPTELEPEVNPVIIEHNRMAAKVMAEMKVPVNDFYALLVDKRQLARGDRFHWTGPAYELLAKTVVESVLRELGKPGTEGASK